MSTQLDPAQLAIEFLRRDKTDLSPAQYLKRLKQLELEFADLLALSSTELKEEIYFALAHGRISFDSCDRTAWPRRSGIRPVTLPSRVTTARPRSWPCWAASSAASRSRG